MHAVLSRWELAAENIALKIRWFGILFGYLIVNLGDAGAYRPILNAILLLGVGYALVDTAYSLRGLVPCPRENVYAPALPACDLYDDVRRGAEAIKTDPLGILSHSQRPIADQPRA